MFCLKSTLFAERFQAAKIAASQEMLICTLRERLEEADSRYRTVLDDLRTAVGLKPRIIQVPTEGVVVQPKANKPETPEWARNVTTPESFRKAAELELNRRWAEDQQNEVHTILGKMS